MHVSHARAGSRISCILSSLAVPYRDLPNQCYFTRTRHIRKQQKRLVHRFCLPSSSLVGKLHVFRRLVGPDANYCSIFVHCFTIKWEIMAADAQSRSRYLQQKLARSFNLYLLKKINYKLCNSQFAKEHGDLRRI